MDSKKLFESKNMFSVVQEIDAGYNKFFDSKPKTSTIRSECYNSYQTCVGSKRYAAIENDKKNSDNSASERYSQQSLVQEFFPPPNSGEKSDNGIEQTISIDYTMLIVKTQCFWGKLLAENVTVIPYSILPMSVSHYKGKLIVTVPRRKPGIPSTVNYIPDDLPVGSSPSLRPYPDFKINELHPELKADANRFVSVYRTRVDDCGRLWFVDTGILEYDDHKKVQQPAVVVIDLNSNEVVRRYEIPDEIIEAGNGMISLTVDADKDNCDNAFAYIPNYYKNKICVYSFEKNDMWIFGHGYLNHESKLTNYNVDGFKFQWTNGVASIAVATRSEDGYRRVFFHPMASNSEFQVNSKILRNKTMSEHPELCQREFVKIGTRVKHSQSGMHDFDVNTSAIFYTLIAKNAIGCWNSNVPYIPENQAIVAQNNMTMNFPADLKVDPDGTLCVLTNNLVKYIYGNLDTNEYNFRLWHGKTKDIVKDTVCEKIQSRS